MGKIIALILAGESRITSLNDIQVISGKPLIFWVIEAALNSTKIDEIYVSTDNGQIKEKINKIKSEKLKIVSGDSGAVTITDFAKSYDFNTIILVHPAFPLLSSDDLDKAIQIFEKEKADSLLSVVRQKKFVWKQKGNYIEPHNFDFHSRPKQQDIKGFLVENGAFYITSKNNLLKTNNIISGNVSCYEMGAESCFEPDEPAGWVIIEKLLNDRKNKRQFHDKLKKIKLLATDIDGVLTDSGMYYSEDGNELKKFSTRDGMGIDMLKKMGIKTALITYENKQLNANRAKKLNIDFLYQGAKNKVEVIKELTEKLNITVDEIAYVGDDVNDTEVLKIAGFSACPSDAVEENKNIVDFICANKGGGGCVREVCDMIMNSRKQ